MQTKITDYYEGLLIRTISVNWKHQLPELFAKALADVTYHHVSPNSNLLTGNNIVEELQNIILDFMATSM